MKPHRALEAVREARDASAMVARNFERKTRRRRRWREEEKKKEKTTLD